MTSRVRQEQIEWRRSKILDLAADGYSIREMESTLKIPRATIGRDIILLRQQAKNDIHKYIQEQVPFEYKKTLAGLEGIIKYTSSVMNDESKEHKERMQAANIKMQAYNMKMEMVSGANLVEEGIELVERYQAYTTQNGKVLKDGTKQST
jgi:hypothetical protein